MANPRLLKDLIERHERGLMSLEALLINATVRISEHVRAHGDTTIATRLLEYLATNRRVDTRKATRLLEDHCILAYDHFDKCFRRYPKWKPPSPAPGLNLEVDVRAAIKPEKLKTADMPAHALATSKAKTARTGFDVATKRRTMRASKYAKQG